MDKNKLETLQGDMQTTYQFKTMNVLEHGESVARTYEEIINNKQFISI